MSALKKFLLFILALPCMAAAQVPTAYTANFVSHSWPDAALNDLGQVAFADEHGRAMIWSKEKGVKPLPGDATKSSIYGLNNDGTAVGSAWLPGQDYYKPVAWHTSAGTDRVEIVSTGGVATAINDKGTIVGYVIDEDFQAQAFVHSGSGNVYIDDFFPAAIDEHGDVAGERYSSVALWRNGELTEVPNGGSGWPNAMNNSGWIVGSAGWWDATLWRDGQAIKLWTGSASDVNDAGTVVGTASFGPAMLWEDGRAYVLDHLWYEPTWSSWSLKDAIAINESGEILVLAQDELEGDMAILLLSPVPEPLPVGLMLAGLALLGGLRFRSGRRSA
jgi:probable HAF family extracellular repeat protein